MIKVVIADDHVIFRQGLLKLLQSSDDISVLSEAGDGHQAMDLIARSKPDIAVLDISMPGFDGFQVLEEINKSGIGTKVIFLTMHNDPSTGKKALWAGAHGYVLKDNAFEDLLYAIRTVYAGRRFISPFVSDKVADLNSQKGSGTHMLTVREREILRLIALGSTNKKIADQLFISVKTVETHRAKIMQKLDMHSTADLVRCAIKAGLLEIE